MFSGVRVSNSIRMSLSANFVRQTGNPGQIEELTNIIINNGAFPDRNFPFNTIGTSISLILGYGYSFTLTGSIQTNDSAILEITISYFDSSGTSHSITLSPPLPPSPGGLFQYNFDTNAAAPSQSPSVLIFAFATSGTVVGGSFLITVPAPPTPPPSLSELIATIIAFLENASPEQRARFRRFACCALECCSSKSIKCSKKKKEHKKK